MSAPFDDDQTPCCNLGGPVVIQEWTGTAWVVADDSTCQGLAYQLLDPVKRPGAYVGEQVRTPCD